MKSIFRVFYLLLILTITINKSSAQSKVYEWNTNSFDSMLQTKPYTLVEFGFLRCPPCRQAAPYFDSLTMKYTGKGFQFYSVSHVNHVNELQEHIQSHPAQYHYIYSTILYNKYGITSFPTFILFDQKGRILHTEEGFTIESYKYMKMVLENKLQKK